MEIKKVNGRLKEKKLVEVVVLGSDSFTEVEWRDEFPEPPERTQIHAPLNLNHHNFDSSLIAQDTRTGDLYHLTYDRFRGYHWRIE